MQINKHGSFYLRNGWPTKIIDVIIQNKYVFSPANEREAVDALGVGRVMVKAMRYWAYATGLTDEDKDQQGVVHSLTELGECVAKYDPFCQDKGTLWLMHRNLASDFENATMWAWAFNLNSQRTFSKDEFVDAFFSFYQTNGGTNKKNAVEKEFDCFKNTYVSDKSFDLSRIIDEDTIIDTLNECFVDFVLYPYQYNRLYKINRVFLPVFCIPEELSRRSFSCKYVFFQPLWPVL